MITIQGGKGTKRVQSQRFWLILAKVGRVWGLKSLCSWIWKRRHRCCPLSWSESGKSNQRVPKFADEDSAAGIFEELSQHTGSGDGEGKNYASQQLNFDTCAV